MEPDADEAPERVRILSTLDASRPPSKRASGRPRRKRGNSWQFKALLALMGLGIVGLLVGFAMVLTQGHSQAGTTVQPERARSALVAAQAANVQPQPATAIATVVDTTTAAPSASAAGVSNAPAPQTAVIEEVAPAAVAGLGTVAAASPLAALGTPPPAPSTTAKAPTPAPAHAAPHRVAKAAPAPAHAEARPRQPATKRGQDADVALLEAMFTHTRAGGTDSERRRRCAQQPQSAGCAPSR